MPGLINAHCHLELAGLGGKIPPGPFPTWVEGLRAFTAALDFENYRVAARQGIGQLLAGGTTTVVDVGNTGGALPALAQGPLRAFGLVEVLGLDPAIALSRIQTAKELAQKWHGSALLNAGLTAHAAYSCSPQLFAQAGDFQQSRGPFTFHAAESREEAELFVSDSGPLAEYCRRIYPPAPRHRHTSPIAYLEEEKLLPDRTLVVHGNTLSSEDIGILKRRQASVVHCPSSHAFFGHPPFPFKALRAAGIRICLGTDSPASGNSLSMLDQIRLFLREFPEVEAREALRMATRDAAKALGMDGLLGTLHPGHQADFIAVRPADAGSDLHHAVLGNGAAVKVSVIAGKEIPGASTL
jgi:cytosine/adenosine deaminase-related metal-dependent hydrolase